MMRILPMTVVALGLSACAMTDRQTLTEQSSFMPTGDGFIYKTIANTNMQEDSSGAERNRIMILEGYLKRNSVCSGGYTVINRQVVNKPKTWLGVKTLKDIIYTGKCTA